MLDSVERLDSKLGSVDHATLRLHGFEVVRDALTSKACDLASHCCDQAQLDSAGSRQMLDHCWCADLAVGLKHHAGFRHLLPDNAVAIQCTLFEKTEKRNWLVALHQDLSVCVAKRVAAVGWGNWTEKEGLIFVQPPPALLEALVAVRIHLDDCPVSAGALRVVPDSHQVASNDGPRLTRDTIEVPLERGDALVLRPLLLHASSKATTRSRRRVLHFLFAPDSPLPSSVDGLSWRWAI